MRLEFDLETFCPVPITYGTHRYAQEAEVMLFLYAIDNGPVECWDVTEDPAMPFDLDCAIDECEEIWGHNMGMFDMPVIKHAMPELYARMPRAKWRDSLVQALAHSLPGSLDKLCEILQIPQDERKLKTGNKLIHLFCKPQPKNQTLRRATRLTHPKEWQEFIDYGKMDVVSARAVHQKCPKWNYPNNAKELALWHLDLEINDRGVKVDTDLALKSIEAIATAQKTLADRTDELTWGDVERATQRDKLLKHLLDAHGVALPDLSKSTLERRMKDDSLPDALRELMAIRLQASMTSTSKYQTLIRGASSDGRLRGLLQFCGASRTGRWAARMFQPQNLPRLDIGLIARETRAKPDDEVVQQYLDDGVAAINAGCADLVFDNVMGLTGNLVRGCIVAPEKKKLVIADLANIEGRVLAWLAGEEWKLKAFLDYDAGIGPDLYKVAYARSFGVPVDSVDKEQRQLGKVQELALGYQGGVGAFVTMAMTYKMELSDIAKAVWGSVNDLPQDLVDEAVNAYPWFLKKKLTHGLDRDVFIACDILKRGWRRAHPAISSFWDEIQNATIQATQNPGVTATARKLKLRRDGNWLRMLLPSGRYLCYPSPRVDDGQISYAGVNPYTRQWQRVKTYGGKGAEQSSQATARDVLAEHLPAINAAGYRITCLVHDEIIAEAPNVDAYTSAKLAEGMIRIPDWAPGLPLAAEGFETMRYRK